MSEFSWKNYSKKTKNIFLNLKKKNIFGKKLLNYFLKLTKMAHEELLKEKFKVNLTRLDQEKNYDLTSQRLTTKISAFNLKLLKS
jgi:hypothetical protein